VIALYDRRRTEISKGALVQLFLALHAYRDDMVLAGGWAPYFLTIGHFEHCGSIDVDIVLRPSVMVKYESIREIVMGLGYVPTESRFRFEKQLTGPTGAPFRFEVDFLTEPQAAVNAGLVTVQPGLDAALVAGSSIAFDFSYEHKVSGTIPGNGEGSELVRVLDVVGCLTMKGLALGRAAKLEKDSYDIYAVAGFHEGSPANAAAQFNGLVSARSEGTLPETTANAIDRISRGFGSQDAYATQAVSRFIGFDVSADAYARIKAFRSELRFVGST
jgi:hypothetical protein